jgi:predicted ribosomally synthesized peptide with nif11-like leader
MSLDQAKAFIEKLETDEAFRDHLIDIEEDDFSGRLAFINSHGFTCTEEEIESVLIHINDPELRTLVEAWLYYY